MTRRFLIPWIVALLGVPVACGGEDEPPEFDGWAREDLESEGSELIEERSGETVQLTCNESLPNDPTVLIACKASDGQQYVFTATEDGELEVLVNDVTPTPEDEPTAEDG